MYLDYATYNQLNSTFHLLIIDLVKSNLIVSFELHVQIIKSDSLYKIIVNNEYYGKPMWTKIGIF